MDIKEKILEFIKQRGPVLPVQIAKHIGSNILMASAHLSELSDHKKLKISNTKVGGGSPVYFLPGQEIQLQRFSNNLHEKEQKAFVDLRQKKILRDNTLEPVIRAALRQIKDFAVPLQVNYKGSTELFWKWYLVTGEEAEELIKKDLNMLSEKSTEPKKEHKPIPPPEPKKEQPKKEQKPNSNSEPKRPEPRKEEPKKEPELSKEIKPKEELKPVKQEQKTLIKKEQIKEKIPEQESDFLKQIHNYLEKSRIQIIEQNIIRKQSDIEMIVTVPSSVGRLTYFCKAKNKKSINDGDLSSTYIHSQSKKMPVLYLTTGKLTKKAKDMLEKEFKAMNIINI